MLKEEEIGKKKKIEWKSSVEKKGFVHERPPQHV
jgi:hypothetical protein